MTKISNYKQALDSLHQLRLFGTKLGLNNIHCLLELLGNPHRRLVFYHIAGTNGKGSTAVILQALLRTTNRRVGLFISPHLEDFRERIRINDRLIGRREVMDGLRELRPLFSRVAETPGCSHPTYFEAVTALACRYYERAKADAVVWEVGLGGGGLMLPMWFFPGYRLSPILTWSISGIWGIVSIRLPGRRAVS